MPDEGMDLALGADDVEQPTIETADAEPVAEETPGGPEAGEQTPESQVESAKLFVNGKINPAFQEEIEKIKATNPVAAKAISKALHEVEGYRRALPQGLKEVKELRAQIEQYGGTEALKESKADLDWFRNLDQQFTSGDPRFVQAMIDTPEGQQAFVKLGPSLIDKYQELNPSGYAAVLAKTVLGDMYENNVLLNLEKLRMVIGDQNPAAAEVLKEIIAWKDRIAGFAKQPAGAPETKPDEQAQRRQQELDQREQELTRNEWATAATGARNKVYESEYERLTKGLKISSADKADIEERYRFKIAASMKQHNGKLEQYFAGGDKTGFLRYLASIDKQEIPKALRYAIDKALPGRKPVAVPGQKTAPAATQTKIEQGFQWVARPPAAGEIDYSNPFNDVKNFLAGKAVLAGGKKVQWSVKR